MKKRYCIFWGVVFSFILTPVGGIIVAVFLLMQTNDKPLIRITKWDRPTTSQRQKQIDEEYERRIEKLWKYSK